MPVRRLPDSPNLEHLKAQANDLRKDHAAQSMMAAQRLREFHPRFRERSDAAIFATSLRQSDALLAIAREYGYPGWPRLKAHVEGPQPVDRWSQPQEERITDAAFRHAVALIDSGNAPGLHAWLAQHPALVHQHVTFEGGSYFHTPTLLNFVAENPVRKGTLTAAVLDVTRIILDAGPDQQSKDETLMLVATGSVPRTSGMQQQLITLLCTAGANADAAAEAAAIHGEPESVRALLHEGATMTLPIAAALGRAADVAQTLPQASPAQRHLALSLAAQHGHAAIVAMLLDAGEDPNRYNPPGGHSHATPLHQAVAFGHAEVVQTLLQRGARTDIKDILWQGTPLDWLQHSNHLSNEIEAMLVSEAGAPVSQKR